MDWILVFGSVAVATMLLMYWLEERASIYVLGFAVACAASSAYAWLAAAYPFGVLEAVWAAVAFRRWQQRVAREHTEAGQT